MHGMFRANGGCGYVKKPDLLLKASPDNHVFDPKVKLLAKKILRVSMQTKHIVPLISFVQLEL